MKITGEEHASGYECVSVDFHNESYGLTIRQQFAMVAMQGLLANNLIIDDHNKGATIWVAEHAISQADKLIKALNETTKPNLS